MKYFTKEQLGEEIKPLSERALEAVNEGQLEKLHNLLNEMAAGHSGLCLLGVQWLGRMLGEIRNKMGKDFLNEVIEEAATYLMTPYARDFLDGDEKSVISELIQIYSFQYPGVVVPLEENDNEVMIELSPCGTGGQLKVEGWPEQLPEFFSPCSDGTPIFCLGCKALQNALNKACGCTVWTTEISETVTGNCTMRFVKQKTSGRKLFEPQEFEQIAKPRCKRALEMINAGNPDTQELQALIDQQHREWIPWHDLVIQWCAGIQSIVYRKKGADYLDSFLKKTYDSAFSMFYPMYEAMDDISMFRFLVQTWHYHIATFTVEEEEDRFVFILDPCGSGGRLYKSDIHKEHFRYNEGLPVLVDEPANISFNRKNFPVYCTHCASSNRDQFEGKPLLFVVDGDAMKDPDSPCRQYLYKKGMGGNLPSELLAQVGK